MGGMFMMQMCFEAYIKDIKYLTQNTIWGNKPCLAAYTDTANFHVDEKTRGF